MGNCPRPVGILFLFAGSARGQSVTVLLAVPSALIAARNQTRQLSVLNNKLEFVELKKKYVIANQSA